MTFIEHGIVPKKFPDCKCGSGQEIKYMMSRNSDGLVSFACPSCFDKALGDNNCIGKIR